MMSMSTTRPPPLLEKVHDPGEFSPLPGPPADLFETSVVNRKDGHVVRGCHLAAQVESEVVKQEFAPLTDLRGSDVG